MLKNSRVVLGGLLFLSLIFSIFFAFQWLKTKKILANQIEISENLVRAINKFKKELIRQIDQNKNLKEKIDELNNEIEKLKKEIEKLKSHSSKTKIHFPILTYHRIDYSLNQGPEDLIVSPLIFEKQMEYLSENNYHPITFEEFLNYLKKEEVPEKSLIITFDDGWKDQYQYAFPILKKYNFKATFFIPVHYLGTPKFMSWKELQDLSENGMEIGSHGFNHLNLSNLSESKLKSEIEESKTILEKKLAKKINVFAYPYGAFNSKVIEQLKKSGYLAARTCLYGVKQNPENIYALKTIRVYNNLDQFKQILP